MTTPLTTAEIVERLRAGDTRKCPFPDTDIEPDQPCPVCGDLGTFDPDNLDKPIRCVASSSRLLLDEAATALSEAKAENERLREALKPFAGDKLPSTKPSVIDYNRHGLRCMMSPMEVAQTAAYRALNPKGGDNGEG